MGPKKTTTKPPTTTADDVIGTPQPTQPIPTGPVPPGTPQPTQPTPTLPINTPTAGDSEAVRLAKIQAENARIAQAREDEDRARQQAEFGTKLDSSYNAAVADAQSYFSSRGLDASQYMPLIQNAATSAKSRIPSLDANPGSYFDGIGSRVYEDARAAERLKYGREIDKYAPVGFEQRRITDTADDATIAAILAEQRQTADSYIQNLLSRGVIKDNGASAAQKELDRQALAARAQLNELGGQQLNSARTKISNIANQGREGAANFELGGSYNPYDYSRDIDTSISDFFSGLGDNLRGLAPSNLFSTEGLAAIAGGAQGAQNMRFDPRALNGQPTFTATNDDEEDQFLNAF